MVDPVLKGGGPEQPANGQDSLLKGVQLESLEMFDSIADPEIRPSIIILTDPVTRQMFIDDRLQQAQQRIQQATSVSVPIRQREK